jgi:membrane dipeptidase
VIALILWVAQATPVEPVSIHADLHVDTPTQMLRRGVGLQSEQLEASLPRMRTGGTNVVVEVLWPPEKAEWETITEKLFSTIEVQDAGLEDVRLARTPAEARGAVAAGKLALLVSLEGAHGIDTSGIEGLRRLHARGLSLLGLTWSFSNRFAGSSGDGGGGLTPSGWELVVEANRLGVVLDVSHASDLTTMQVCGWSHAPVIASHSDVDAVRAHARNLSDEAIRCIAATGGVIGLNFHADFVGRNRDIAAVADHADHLRRIGGAGVVALGSDFDGLIKPVSGLPDASRVGALWEELARRGWTTDDIAAAQGANFMRAWERAVTVAAALRGEPTPP